MKTFELLRREFTAKLRSHPLSILIILLSLTLSLAVLFPISAYLKEETNKLGSIADDMSTYSFVIFPKNRGEAEKSLELFDEVFFSGKYPETRQCHDKPFFRIFSDEGFVPFISWNVYTKEVSSLDRSERWREDSEGGWFTDPRFKGRDDAAVVSVKDYPAVKPGDRISILGREAEVIAVSEETNILPWGFIKNTREGAACFGVDSFTCVFSRPLNSKELSSLKESGIADIRSQIEITGSGYIVSILLLIAVLGGLLFITVMNMRNLFIHVFRRDAYRTAVMKACGCGAGKLLLTIYAFPFIICTAAYLLGLAAHLCFFDGFLSERLGYAPMNAAEYLLIYALALLFLFIVLLPAARRTIRSSVTERRLWR